jgi:hypothetical protein
MIKKTKQDTLTLNDTDEIIDAINAKSQTTGQRPFDCVCRVVTFRCEREQEPPIIVEIRYAGETPKNYECVATRENGSQIAASGMESELRKAVKFIWEKLSTLPGKAQ